MADVESVLEKLLAVAKAGLNTEIEAINTKKKDGIVLSTIPDKSWYENAAQVMNSKVFVVFGFDELETKTVGSAVQIEVPLFFEVVIRDPQRNNENQKRALRYMEAMLQTFLKKFGEDGSLSDFTIKPLVPMAANRSNTWYRQSGLEIRTTITRRAC